MFTGERALESGFQLEDIGWIDFETACALDLKLVGTYRYACEALPLICAWAIGDGVVTLSDITLSQTGHLAWLDMPLEFRKFHNRVEKGEAIWAAWNAGFDRAIWNYSTNMFHIMEHHHIIDVAAQAMAAGLPPDLKMAAKWVGSEKLEEGRELIKLFCSPGSTATPKSHPTEWLAFLKYAAQDIHAMRDVYMRTRPLARAEWQEYWAMESINSRGVAIDLPMVENAAVLASLDKDHNKTELRRLTDGVVASVDQVKRMTEWLLPRLPAEGQSILTKREEEVDEDGEIIKPAKFQLTRARVEKLRAYVQAQLLEHDSEEADWVVLRKMERVLEIRKYGGSKTPAKFGKMLQQHIDGVLYGQYVFNGAAGTGRASSRGVQIHNLARDVLPFEHEAIEALLNDTSYNDLQALDPQTPVARILSLLIRPAFVPQFEGNTFVWSDWSNVEAIILPWLAGDSSSGALERLAIFRAVHADSSVPDVYTRTAARISNVPIGDVDETLRQRGKVAELALGFGGGVGALQNMGANYGLYLTEDESRKIVTQWRSDNLWAVQFWGRHDDEQSVGVWGAINRAIEHPQETQYAGRVAYVFCPGYLGGSLICVLPSSRLLTYRALRVDRVEDLDDDDKPLGTFTNKLRFSRGHGRVPFWHGLAVENIVQAVAADILRGTLRRLEDERIDVRLHTHDEILIECNEKAAWEAAKILRGIMRRGFDWSEGLPLFSRETISPYYTKQKLEAA